MNTTLSPVHPGRRRIDDLLLALKSNRALLAQPDSVFRTCLANKDALSSFERRELFQFLYEDHKLKPGMAIVAEMLLQLPLQENDFYVSRDLIDLAAANGLGRTVLMEVVSDYRATYEVIDYLLYRIDDVDAKDFYGRTALIQVVSQGVSPRLDTLRVVKQLISGHADPTITDCAGDSAIDIARLNENLSIVEFLESL